MENVIDLREEEISSRPIKLLFTQSVVDSYKNVSEVINSVEPRRPKVRVKGMRAMIEESFFHGASFMGNNFIA